MRWNLKKDKSEYVHITENQVISFSITGTTIFSKA